MKKGIKIVLLLILAGFLANCVNDDSFSIPNIGEEENKALTEIQDNIENNADWNLISISDLKNQFTSGSDAFQITSNLVVKGYVISSDQNGNFFREFYLQDSPSNPTSGIKVALNLTNSYNKFNIGREVYIYLKDLYVGEVNSGDGVTSIGGKLDDNEIDLISENQIEKHLFRSENTEIIEPLLVTIPEINQNYIGLFVTIDEVFFSENSKGKPYVDENDDFDTQRIFKSCQAFEYVDFTLETSSFAIFKNEILPSSSGTISGIVSKTFNGDKIVLALNTSNDVTLKNSEICTPLNIDDFPLTLLNEEFEEATRGNINIANWTNYNQEGSKYWNYEEDETTLRRFAEISAYSFVSGDQSIISWLITESVNLDTTTEEYLSFETSNSFANGSELEVLISTDWNGDNASISTSNWEKLPAIIVQDSEDFENWIFSSYINLTSYSGSVYIAFKYTGSSDEEFNGTYELDNIKIIAK